MDTTQFGGDDANRRALVDSTRRGRRAARPPASAGRRRQRPGSSAAASRWRCCATSGSPPIRRSFGWPELRCGIPTSYGADALAAAPAVAADLALTGRIVERREALSLGLVSAVVPDAELPALAAERAAQIAALPPAGVRGNKAWIRAAVRRRRRQIDREWELFRSTVLSREPEPEFAAAGWLDDERLVGATGDLGAVLVALVASPAEAVAARALPRRGAQEEAVAVGEELAARPGRSSRRPSSTGTHAAGRRVLALDAHDPRGRVPGRTPPKSSSAGWPSAPWRSWA